MSKPKMKKITHIHASPCTHPASRLYTWRAYDGTQCVCCCICGAVLKGGAK